MTEPRRPVFWYQGLFLQPQHFQHADLFTQSLLAPLRRYLQPYFWGVCRLGVNETALREGTFDLAEGEFIFQDGTWVSLAGNGRVKPRSFKDLAAREDRLTVYLGLRKWRDDRPNVASLTGRDLPSDVDRRFVSGPETYESSDLYQQGPATQLKLLDYALRLFWEMEAEGAGEFHLLPIARLKLDTRQPALCTDFVPPLVTTGASVAVLDTIRSIRELLHSRCRLLDIYKERGALAGSISGVQLTSFLALRSLNRYIPILSHMLEAIDLHPWHFYGVLRQFVGELSSFSEQYDALGRLKDGSEHMAPYNHENLGHCFQTAALLIEEMLDGLSGGMETSITLQREGDYFRGKIPADFFGAQYGHYLQIRTSESRNKLVEMAGHLVKLGADEEIEQLMSRALPGVRIEPVKGPVPGLAEVPDVINMRADTSSRSWDEVRKRRTICLYWKDAPADMAVALVIARKHEGTR